MKTKLIAIAAAAAVVLTPLAGVAAASATTEEVASSPAISTSAASPTSPALNPTAQTSTSTTTSTTTSTELSSTGSPSTGSSEAQGPAATGPAAGSSSSPAKSDTDGTAPSTATGLPLPSSSPSTSECTVANRSHVHAERVGPASFSAWVDAGYECGAWVTTFAFDDGYVPTSTDDYRHPQTALEWGYAQLTTTPTVHSVPAPKCGPFQSDLSVGPLVLHLADGELGSQWRAGGVVLSNPDCTPTEEPSSTPTPGPTPPTTSSPTSEPSPPATDSPAPSPSSTTPAGSTPTGPAPTTGASNSPTAARESQRIAQTAAPQSDALAYTGSDLGAWPFVALLLILAGSGMIYSRVRKRHLASVQKKEDAS